MADRPNKTLAGIVVAATAAFLFSTVPQHESIRLVGYLDPVGIPTKCMGDTTNVVVGRRYSDAECRESLERQLIAHAEPVLRCTPVLKGHTYQLAGPQSVSPTTSAYRRIARARRPSVSIQGTGVGPAAH